MEKFAVVLFNLGGPDSLDAVEPFLYSLFCDRDIFKIPIGQKFFAKMMSKLRSPVARENYQKIGGRSPINHWTEIQRSMLERQFQLDGANVHVFAAMRYSHPTIKNVSDKITRSGFDKIVLLPLYPHYSSTTTGSSFNEWKRVYRGDASKLIYIESYFSNNMYIHALNERIDESLLRFPENVLDDIQIVFSAHGTPISLVKSGDPYKNQIEETVVSVMSSRNFAHSHHLCFQSKVGPVKWLKPSIGEMIEKLSSEGKRQLLIVPISFVSDHIETLFEIDIEYRKIAVEKKIENYIVMKGLNDSEIFVTALKQIVNKHLKR